MTSNTVLKGAAYGSATPLSGTGQLDIGDPGNPTNTAGVVEGTTSFTINFGAITGGAVNEAVTSVALTANSRGGNASTAGMFVTFSDNTTSSTLSRALAGTAASDDIFYGFVAPAGLSISSLTVGRTARQPFDDLGFITSVVPESASLRLLSLSAIGSTRRLRAGAWQAYRTVTSSTEIPAGFSSRFRQVPAQARTNLASTSRRACPH